MLRTMIAFALAVALAGIALADEEIEIDVDKDGCFKVPDKCMSIYAEYLDHGPAWDRFWVVVHGACSGRTLVRVCIEGHVMIGGWERRHLFSGQHSGTWGESHACMTTWRDLDEKKFMSKIKPGQWVVPLSAYNIGSTIPNKYSAPTGRYYGAWIGSTEPENDLVCIGKHEGWGNPPAFRN